MIGDERAVEPLILLTSDSRHDVRAGAAWALGEIGDERALQPLTAMLGDEREDARREASSALEKLKKVKGTPAPAG
jgi:HEAT repeat protein